MKAVIFQGMRKFTILDAAGNPNRVIFMPEQEIGNQLADGESCRSYEDGDIPNQIGENPDV